MNRRSQHTRALSKRWRLPRWMALILAPVVLLLAHVALPQQLSLLSARHGWANGEPGWLNLLGVIPIGAGAAFLVWSLCLHFVAVRDSFEVGRTQNYLVVGGPYRFTRNPMYLFGMLIWLGWIIFYGSVAVLAGTVIIWGSVAMLVVPSEERNLEARFGEAYLLQYKHSVPRWLGRRSR
jgi:protein-S-isoprenylcysteine O-methyltransferase Ste14